MYGLSDELIAAQERIEKLEATLKYLLQEAESKVAAFNNVSYDGEVEEFRLKILTQYEDRVRRLEEALNDHSDHR